MRLFPFILAVALLVLFDCSGNKDPFSGSGNWTSDIPFVINHVNITVPHDDRIYETAHFLVFSDAAEDEVKMDFAKKAEKAFGQVLDAFDISNPADLGVDDNPDSKLTVYTITSSGHSQLAFPYGYMLHGLDSKNFSNWPDYMKSRFFIQMKHETVHVVQFLLGVLNPDNRENEPDRWFNEGLAEYISGGFFIPIKDHDDYVKWKRSGDHINPISIHQWSALPIPASRVGEYYPMFGLAVQYLLDKKGLNRSIQDVKFMFADLASGNFSFEEAFHSHFGISLAEYEISFFERMDNYLK